MHKFNRMRKNYDCYICHLNLKFVILQIWNRKIKRKILSSWHQPIDNKFLSNQKIDTVATKKNTDPLKEK